MKIENRVPEWFLLSETKLNQQSFESACAAMQIPGYEERWIKANGSNLASGKTSSSEKGVAFFLEEFETCENSKFLPVSEYMKDFLKEPVIESYLRHFHVTVLFRNVSHRFFMLLVAYQKLLATEKINTDGSMSIWLPPFVESDPEMVKKFSEFLISVGNNAQDFVSEARNHIKNPEDMLQFAHVLMRLYPMMNQTSVLVTGNILDWRDTFLDLTSFHMDDEVRFVFLNLARDFKKRYYSFFQDIVTEKRSGIQLGIDSLIATDDSWKDYQLAKLDHAKFKKDTHGKKSSNIRR